MSSCAKKAEEAQRLSTVEEQSDEYSTSKLKFFGKQDLRFIYESTGEVTRIRDTHDPKTRAREVFSFMKPDTVADELAKGRWGLSPPKSFSDATGRPSPRLGSGRWGDARTVGGVAGGVGAGAPGVETKGTASV